MQYATFPPIQCPLPCPVRNRFLLEPPPRHFRQVQVPRCAGAEALWRSTGSGWEKLDSVTFDDCSATVTLDHFCDLVITGKCIPLKCIGFLHPHGENAQIVIMHIGCEFCQSGLELLCSDEDVLQPLRKCGPSLQLGMFRHEDELEIHQAGRTSKIKMRFDQMPLSRRLYAQSGLQFDVEIDGENHVFEAPTRPPALAPQHAPSRAPHPSPGLHSAPSAQALWLVCCWITMVAQCTLIAHSTDRNNYEQFISFSVDTYRICRPTCWELC